MHESDPDNLPAQLLPFFISRTPLLGAGGFDPRSPIRFSLSPRSAYLRRVISPHSTSERGIYHTKEEPLAGRGNHRLHVLCGESLCSNLGNWLKAGTTALVVALAEAGARPGEAVTLRWPLRALAWFAADPTCRARARSKTGRLLSAVDIQRHYLQAVEANLTQPYMPPWAPKVAQEWRAMLDRLAGAPDSVAGCLDWAIKLRLFKRLAERRGIEWESLAGWNRILQGLRRSLPGGVDLARPDIAPVLDPAGPLGPRVKALRARAEAVGLDWAKLPTVLALRLDLFALDTRFGELGPGGVFNSLDRAGALNHAVAGVDNIAHARTEPPALGRARLRGEVIRKLAGNGGDRYVCDWTAIYDCEGGRLLDLHDPWATQERWHQHDPATAPASRIAWLDQLVRHLRAPF